MTKIKDILFIVVAALLILGAGANPQIVGIGGFDEDSNFTPASMDGDLNALIQIDFERHELEQGYSFFFTDIQTIGDGSTYEYLLETGSSPSYLTFNVVGKYDTKVEIYEGTSKTTGTSLDELNSNRGSASTADSVLTHTPAGSGDGTLIYQFRSRDDSNPQAAGGQGGTRKREELILSTDDDYLIRVTSYTADNVVSVHMKWDEEHTP